MGFELFVAMRYLTVKRKQTFISIISMISVLGVAIGVASLIVAIGVLNGFTTEFRNKMVGFNSHIIVNGVYGAIPQYEGLRREILEVPGVVQAAPFIYSELMVSAPSGRAKGIRLFGIEPATAPQVLTVLGKLEEGSLENLVPGSPESDQASLPGIIIGKPVKEHLRTALGQRINLIAPSGRSSTAGVTPSIKPFRVAGVFKSGLANFDDSMTYVDLASARNVLGLQGDTVSGINVVVKDLFAADQVAKAVKEKLGPEYIVRSWTEFNAQMYAAFKLEKIVTSIVLGLIVLVGSFSIVAALVMLVMEKTKDIAIMMSMGATSGAIRRIFMLQGVIIGVVGVVAGFLLGLGLAFLLKRYQFIEIPADTYPVDYIPVLLQGQDLALIAAGTMLICFLATLYPARQAARLAPAEALHYE